MYDTGNGIFNGASTRNDQKACNRDEDMTKDYFRFAVMSQ